jgi:hypothetical protein
MTSGYLPSTVGGGDLVAGPTWEEIQSLSLSIVAQGRKAIGFTI